MLHPLRMLIPDSLEVFTPVSEQDQESTFCAIAHKFSPPFLVQEKSLQAATAFVGELTKVVGDY